MHRPDLYLKYNILETGFCLLLQVEPTQVGPIDPETETICSYWVYPSRFHLKTETESSVRNVKF
jgi:hypothetical protein